MYLKSCNKPIVVIIFKYLWHAVLNANSSRVSTVLQVKDVFLFVQVRHISSLYWGSVFSDNFSLVIIRRRDKNVKLLFILVKSLRVQVARRGRHV